MCVHVCIYISGRVYVYSDAYVYIYEYIDICTSFNNCSCVLAHRSSCKNTFFRSLLFRAASLFCANLRRDCCEEPLKKRSTNIRPPKKTWILLEMSLRMEQALTGSWLLTQQPVSIGRAEEQRRSEKVVRERRAVLWCRHCDPSLRLACSHPAAQKNKPWSSPYRTVQFGLVYEHQWHHRLQRVMKINNGCASKLFYANFVHLPRKSRTVPQKSLWKQISKRKQRETELMSFSYWCHFEISSLARARRAGEWHSADGADVILRL